MKIVELLNTAMKLGIEPEKPGSRLVATSTEKEIRAIGVAVASQDLKEHVIVIDEGGKDAPDPLVYLLEDDLTRQVVDNRYRSLLNPMGIEPLVRTKAVKRGDSQVVTVIDVPLLDAQVALALGDLGRQIPEIYTGRKLNGQNADFVRCGAEARELYAKFALGRIGTFRQQIRAERSKLLAGRAKNVAEDIGATVTTSVGKRVRRVFHPHITALPEPKK